MKRHCMLDLESLGTATDSLIVAIGAVAFTADKVWEKFYTNVSIDSGLGFGLNVDAGAIKFWMLEASPQNRLDLFDQPRGLRESLSAFTTFYQQNDCHWLWSHGANFDEPMLRSSYKAVYGNFVPWAFRGVRDTRTLFALAGGSIPVPRDTEKHNALADAEYQAACVQAAYMMLGKEMET